APMIGGLATSFLMELLVYPAIYLLWRGRTLAAPAVVHVGWRRPAIVGGIVAVIVAAYMAWPQHEATTPLFPRHEAVRQALLGGSLERTKSAAAELDGAATRAKQPRIATTAAALATSGDVTSARTSFAALSEAVTAER